MSYLKLKKLFAKAELFSLIENLSQLLETPLMICDLEGNILYGQQLPQSGDQYPISVGNHTIGWVKGEAKVKTIAQIISCFANQELEKKNLAIETLNKYEELNFLYDISEQIANCLGIQEVISLIIDEVRKLIKATHISIMLLNPATEMLEIISGTHRNYQAEKITAESLGIAGHVLRSRKAEIVNNVISDPRYIQGSKNIHSLICAPLTIHNQTIGVINVSHSEPINYTAEDLKLFTALTSQAAAAIQAAQYYEELKEYSHTLEKQVAKRTIALEKANQELQKLAAYDELTQIANRRYFNYYFHHEWRRLLRDKYPLSLIICDVDYFKAYNDYYGHQAGDECLKKVAQAMKFVVKRPADLVARYGGEEFVIILSNTNSLGATKVTEKICSAIDNLKIPHALSQVSQYITLSFGIADTIPTQNISPETLITVADRALYQAKEEGRNCYKLKAFRPQQSKKVYDVTATD